MGSFSAHSWGVENTYYQMLGVVQKTPHKKGTTMVLNAISSITQEQPIAEIVLRPQSPLPNPQQSAANAWVEIFDPLAAVSSVFKHIETLPSSRTTRHTARQYRISLYDFLKFCGAAITQDQHDKTRMTGDTLDFSKLNLHTEDQMKDYINHCIDAGRSSKTIKKYLAPIHLYLNALRKQPFIGFRGDMRDLIHDAKDVFQMAVDVKAPKEVFKSSQSAGQRGVRLNLTQVKEYLSAIDRDTLSGKRDAAIFYVGLVSMLRVSELQRMRLCDIKQGTKTAWEITVIGKRNNIDPVGLDQIAYRLIMDYVDAYNEALTEDDKRRITQTTALWQPLRHGNNHEQLGINNYHPNRGMSANAIRSMLKRRTPAIICEQTGTDGIRPHDLRRTTALGLAEQNVPIPAIQRQLRHANAQTTSDYIGTFTDLSRGLISNYWTSLID